MTMFYVEKDYETSERVGAEGSYQLRSLLDENQDSILYNKDGSERYNQGDHYTDDELKEVISSK